MKVTTSIMWLLNHFAVTPYGDILQIPQWLELTKHILFESISKPFFHIKYHIIWNIDFWAIYGGIILDWPTFWSVCNNKTNNNYHVLNHAIIWINVDYCACIVTKWDFFEDSETLCTYTIKSLKSHSNNVDLLLFVRALCTLRTYCCFASKYCISCDLRAGIFFLESWCSWSPSCKEKDAHWNNRV